MSEPTAEHVLVDSDRVPVTVYEWRTDEPRAVVHIVHGVGEHARRYAALAERLTAAGYAVYADDHRGHGATGEAHLGIGHLGPRAIRGAMASVQEVAEDLRLRHPSLPLVLLGHSWGSLMGQKLIARGVYDAAVLSGTSLAVPGYLNSGDLNKPWRGQGGTGLEWLSRDPAAAEAFAADPWCFDIAEKPAWNTVQALALVGRPPRSMPRDIPILIMGGSEDTLGGARGMSALARAYRERSHLTDVSLAVYEGARHEIFNETNRDEVIGDLIAWLDAHVPAA